MAIKKSKKAQVQKVVKKEKVIKTVSSKSVGVAMVSPKGEYVVSVGRRKVATARVRLYAKPGDFMVNGLAVGQYFQSLPNAAAKYNLPFNLTNSLGKHAVTVKIVGGGVSGQLGALVHGIARALIKFNPEYRELFKETSLLTRDDRMKESRKIGTGGKARRKRQSPKR
jgi:small subunit ribosomal protein S9